MAAPTGPPKHSQPAPSAPPYQAGFEGGVQPARQQVLPVDVAEEGLFLWDLGVSGRIWGVSPGTPCTPLYLHISCITRAPANPLAGVPLEELEEK